jgi:hypothetical protein
VNNILTEEDLLSRNARLMGEEVHDEAEAEAERWALEVKRRSAYKRAEAKQAGLGAYTSSLPATCRTERYPGPFFNPCCVS